MAKIELKKLTLEELKKLQKDVAVEITNFSERKRSAAKKALEAVAKEHGMSLDDIVGSPKKKKKAKAAAKYRNPANASETWSGRGRQPAWYKAAVAGGTAPEKLEI